MGVSSEIYIGNEIPFCFRFRRTKTEIERLRERDVSHAVRELRKVVSWRVLVLFSVCIPLSWVGLYCVGSFVSEI